MERFKPLRRYLSLQSFAINFLVLTAAVSAGVLASYYTTTTYAVLVGVGVAFVGILIGAIKAGKEGTRGAEFLARAILHVAKENSTVGAPKGKMLPASRQFFEELAAQVYDMASKGLGFPGAPAETDVKPADSKVEAFQRSLLANTPLAIYALDKENRLAYANQAGLEYAGLNPQESVGQPFYDIVKLSFASDKTLDEWLQESSESRLTGTKAWDRVRLTLGDGAVKQCDMAARFNKDNPDGVETVILLFDHTERYTKDDQGTSAVSMAVHELRTPLTIMRGYIEVFEEELLPQLTPEQAEYMRGLSAQAQQLSSFVNNIMNFTRIEENDLAVIMKEEDWGAIVDQAVRNMELRARVRHKSVQAQIEPNLPHVAVDHTTINEVLVNLIENAIKYTHSEAPVVVRTYKKDDNWVETTVEDKGIGIPSSLVGHIFDKFYRSHRSNKSVGGTGLGLYITKAIVTAHGGEIWVKTKDGEGSTFGFTIPTFASVADQVNNTDTKGIVRGAHGWIKNHSMYRG